MPLFKKRKGDVTYRAIGHKCLEENSSLVPFETLEKVFREHCLRKIPDFPLHHGLNGRLWAESPFLSFLSHFGIVYS